MYHKAPLYLVQLNNVSERETIKENVLKMTENEKLRNMVLAFRMSELQCLMVFAGKSKVGRKTDLQVSLKQHGFNKSIA